MGTGAHSVFFRYSVTLQRSVLKLGLDAGKRETEKENEQEREREQNRERVAILKSQFAAMCTTPLLLNVLYGTKTISDILRHIQFLIYVLYTCVCVSLRVCI